ncbi:hypothetical protein Syun_000470 [Stephania yunnanensis]|uniref:BHLH domain-containing protein n=1 Tax=Stephania yunnanensis TaxID=152371 RepID=A0AAP0LEV5_9MAGN
MGSSSLRQLLRIICHALRWDYAVFWKLHHQSEMLLSWEDGYCHLSALSKSRDAMLSNACISERALSSPKSHSHSSDGMSLAFASMSCLRYSLGEGFVGRVASTGKDCWISVDDWSTELLSEYSEEWQLQFAAGIKTILLVPVVPIGVVQLGSLEKVAQDPSLVALVKDIVNNLLSVQEVFTSSSSHEDLNDLSLFSERTFLEDLPESSAVTTLDTQSRLTTDDNVLELFDKQMTKEELLATTLDIMSQLTGEDIFQVQGSNVSCTRDALLGPPDDGLMSVSQSKYSKEMEIDMPNHACGMDMKFGPKDHMNSHPTEDATGEETSETDSLNFLNFPLGSELHKALGDSCYDYLWDTSAFVEDIFGGSGLYHSDPTNETSISESKGWFLKDGEVNNLLGAVVANMNDASANRSNNLQSPKTSSEQFAASCQTESPSVCNVLGGRDSSPLSNDSSSCVPQNGELFSSSTLEHKTSKFMDEKQQRMGLGHIQPRKGARPSHISKKKGRLDGQKPRPRDRQMIQDRVKELRELVPNGAKCSIDALLHKTIKHMLFLRSATGRAEKLKKRIYPKKGGATNHKLLESHGHRRNGVTWAYELGSDDGEFPIIARDLDQPGQMLIEMLCEDYGLFLDITLVIRRLKLSILKGVMEKRSDKTWAHFIVEASKGFQRTDIFWPLMQLLQRNYPRAKVF